MSLTKQPALIEQVLNRKEHACENEIKSLTLVPSLRLHHSIFMVDNMNTDVLGQGSYGTVYSGVQKSHTENLPVAIKVHSDEYLLYREV